MSDCRALVALARSVAEGGDLPENHVLRGWGRDARTKIESWSGVRVSQGRVTRIGLDGIFRNSRLTGFIPSELGMLTALTHIDLSDQQLSGPIPSELSALTELNEFDLANGRGLTDISALSGMTNLVRLRLRGNRIVDISPLAGADEAASLGFESEPDLEHLVAFWLGGAANAVAVRERDLGHLGIGLADEAARAAAVLQRDFGHFGTLCACEPSNSGPRQQSSLRHLAPDLEPRLGRGRANQFAEQSLEQCIHRSSRYDVEGSGGGCGSPRETGR